MRDRRWAQWGNRQALEGLPIATSSEDWPAQASLYERVLGPAFRTLPPTVQTMHQPRRGTWAEGEAEVIGLETLSAAGRVIRHASCPRQAHLAAGPRRRFLNA